MVTGHGEECNLQGLCLKSPREKQKTYALLQLLQRWKLPRR
jgi:hypothetical protein